MRLFIILILMASGLWAGEDYSQSQINYNNEGFALRQQASQDSQQEIADDIEKKSGLRAALYSAVIPGAGQFYTESYWRAALYAGLEIAFWTANVVYNQKGSDEDATMRAYGDAHWIEQRYWSSIYHRAVDNELPVPDASFDENGVLLDDYYTPEMISTLRGVESKLGTHTLPTTKTQQYYEMIYKYLHQFGAGWDDVPSLDYYEFHSTNNLTPNISAYRDMRNLSNDYYNTADLMINLILVNHVISAIDAAWSAKNYNKRYEYSFGASPRRIGYETINMYGITVVW